MGPPLLGLRVTYPSESVPQTIIVMAADLHALDYLSKRPAKAAPVCVSTGDEPYLKRLVYDALRCSVLGADDDFSEDVFEGRTAELRDVLDAVSTASLFAAGGSRLVVVRDADDFVSRYREPLEKYVQRPRSTGVLLLEVRSWPKNTRLAKQVAQHGLTIDCSAPPPAKLRRWLTTRAKQHHQCKMTDEAAEFLLEVVGPEPGVLDQELAKLATAAGTQGPIDLALAESLVAGGRARTAWDMLDAAMDGRVDEALAQLDRLLRAGENPIALLAQIASNLRRLAAALALLQYHKARNRRITVRDALSQAGVRPFVLKKSEAQLRRLGRARASKLLRWLLEADLDLKGQSQLDGRTVLERLLIRLGRRLDPL